MERYMKATLERIAGFDSAEIGWGGWCGGRLIRKSSGFKQAYPSMPRRFIFSTRVVRFIFNSAAALDFTF